MCVSGKIDWIEGVTEMVDVCSGVRSSEIGMGRVGRGTRRGTGAGLERANAYLGTVSVKV